MYKILNEEEEKCSFNKFGEFPYNRPFSSMVIAGSSLAGLYFVISKVIEHFHEKKLKECGDDEKCKKEVEYFKETLKRKKIPELVKFFLAGASMSAILSSLVIMLENHYREFLKKRNNFTIQ